MPIPLKTLWVKRYTWPLCVCVCVCFVMVLGVTDVVAGVLHRVGYSYYQFILCGDHMRQLSEALMCTDPGSMCPDLWGVIR